MTQIIDFIVFIINLSTTINIHPNQHTHSYLVIVVDIFSYSKGDVIGNSYIAMYHVIL